MSVCVAVSVHVLVVDNEGVADGVYVRVSVTDAVGEEVSVCDSVKVGLPVDVRVSV